MAPYSLSPPEQAVIDTAISLSAQLSVEQTCEAVLDAVDRLYEARSSWVLLQDPSTGELVTVAYRGPDATAYMNARIPANRPTIVGKAFHDREPLFVPDVREEDRWYDRERVHRTSLRSVFTVPLVFEDTALGVLGVDSARFSSESPPQPEDIARLRAIAAQATVAVRNARLYEAVHQDRARLRRVLQERRQFRSEVKDGRGRAGRAHATSLAVGNSAAFRQLLGQVELVAPADSTVLLIGETGTGKELVARLIHGASRRRAQPFIAVNCAALPESLVESELFGHEKGAFTGALAQQPGKFELADRGTMLLDEIGDLPAAAQAKLLRVLQEREVQRVGGTRPVPINVRLIAATNQDLESSMHAGKFRADLFYRLSVFPIHLPPLRERREDIPALVTHFVRSYAENQQKAVPDVGPGVLEVLLRYEWPGNVRELQNVVERAVILCHDGVITRDEIAINLASSVAVGSPSHVPGAAEASPEPGAEPMIVRFSEAERRAIIRALELTGWRISGQAGAAEVLGLKATTLHAKMKKLGIHRPSVAQHEQAQST